MGLLLAVLNAIDAASTDALLSGRLACEANPLMRGLWEWSPAAFVGAKLSVGTAAGAFLHYAREHKSARLVSAALCCVYAAVLAWHLVIWTS